MQEKMKGLVAGRRRKALEFGIHWVRNFQDNVGGLQVMLRKR